MIFDRGVRVIMFYLCGDHAGNLNWERVPLPDMAVFSIGDTTNLE